MTPSSDQRGNGRELQRKGDEQWTNRVKGIYVTDIFTLDGVLCDNLPFQLEGCILWHICTRGRELPRKMYIRF